MKKYIVHFTVFTIIVMHCFIQAETTQVALPNEQKYSAYDIIGRAIAPFKSGYGYSKEDKEKAHLEIARLEQEKINLEQQYKKDLSESFGTYHEQSIKDQFKKNITDLDNQIYQQKIITGEIMSTKRKLFWAGVGITAATVGGMIIYKYFTKEPQALGKKQQKFDVDESKIQKLDKPKDEIKEEPSTKIKQEIIKKFELPKYQSPSLVDNPYYLEGLQSRLDRILEQKEVRNEKGLRVKNPNYNVQDEQEARQAVEKAKQLIKDFPYSYVSPPLVEYEADVKGHQKRLELIQNQKNTDVRGFLRKNPRYNVEDEYFEKNALRKAQAIYAQAKFEIPPAVTDEVDVEAFRKRYKFIRNQEYFSLKFNNQYELIKNPFYDSSIANRALEDVERAKRKLEKLKQEFAKFDEQRKREEELRKKEEESKKREEKFKERVEKRKENMRKVRLKEWMIR